MQPRRLDDRIRFLCSKLVALPDNKDAELLAAIREKVRRVRNSPWCFSVTAKAETNGDHAKSHLLGSVLNGSPDCRRSWG